MPGSEPPIPDNAERVAQIIAALNGGTQPTGVAVSEVIAKILTRAETVVVHDTIYPSGTTSDPHHVYEAFGVAFLSPPIV